MKKYTLITVIAVLVIAAWDAFFVIDQKEQGLVLQFGEPVKVVDEPGLNIKIPLFQNVLKFEKRILNLHAKPKELISADQERLIVDAFAKYKITDPLKFYQSVNNTTRLNDRLNKILDSRLRKVIGDNPMSRLLTDGRSEITSEITAKVSEEARFGIEVVDVRIRRADLVPENSEAIYQQMRTEREKEAKEFRARGAEEAQRIRAIAEKDRTVLLAEAEKQAQILRGEGDAEATRIFAESFGRDQEFFAFYRSMQAYRKVLNKGDTSMVLSPDSEFLSLFDSTNP